MINNKNYHICSIILIMLFTFLLNSCWYTKQAKYFLKDRTSAISIKTLRKDSKTTRSELDFFAKIDDIKDYSVNKLGLKRTNNYSTYIFTKKSYVADVVSACDKISFKRYLWNYPILGKLPYRGFYERADAEAEAAKLKEQNYDVIVRNVEAFSSLGYSSDPLYSFMKNYTEAELADLIIHESAHATLFIKGEEQFNEEFATFIGREGAKQYLLDKNADIEAIKAYSNNTLDRNIFVDFLKKTATELEKIYNNNSLTTEEKLAKKNEIILSRAKEYKAIAQTLFSNNNYQNFDMQKINNAYIDLYRLYEDDLSLYEEWFTKIADRSIDKFVKTIISKIEDKKNIKEKMKKILDSYKN